MKACGGNRMKGFAGAYSRRKIKNIIQAKNEFLILKSCYSFHKALTTSMRCLQFKSHGCIQLMFSRFSSCLTQRRRDMTWLMLNCHCELIIWKTKQVSRGESSFLGNSHQTAWSQRTGLTCRDYDSYNLIFRITTAGGEAWMTSVRDKIFMNECEIYQLYSVCSVDLNRLLQTNTLNQM